MDFEWLSLKEDVILVAKDKIEEAAEALMEFLPDLAEELNWFLEELDRSLCLLRAQRLQLPDGDLYEREEMI